MTEPAVTYICDPLDPRFPVPLDGMIPVFWQTAAAFRDACPQMWDGETRRAARWANGPRPPGGEPQWRSFVQPLPPPPYRPGPADLPLGRPPLVPAWVPPAVVHEERLALEPGAGWDPPTAQETATLMEIWPDDPPPGRLFMRRGKGRHQ